MRFLPHTPEDIREMLAAMGVGSVDDLFATIPEALRKTAAIKLPDGLTEQGVVQRLDALAARNPGASNLSFLGAGAYPHFVPALVDQILRRAEFYSSYTPYQPEVSQGTLQAIFEFQTLVAMLMEMEVSNASMYDGASATAEAVLMALRLYPKRKKIIIARSIHPEYRQVTTMYLAGMGNVEVVEAPFATDGRLDLAWLDKNVNAATAGLVVGYPNFFGVIEDLGAIRKITESAGCAFVTTTSESLALALLKPPGSFGADIAVGEGQSLGVAMSYGGPGLGLFATRSKHVRNMPGRLVGEAYDEDGRRGYVLTLATREQHIRREKATSNICTNHGLIALASTVYLSLLGKAGLRQLAQVNVARAHDAQAKLCGGKRWKSAFGAPFFNEFVVRGKGAADAVAKAQAAGVLAGIPLGRWYPELDDCIQLAVTEVHSAADLARLSEVLA